MPFFARIYDRPAQKLLLFTSRQSTKTTYLRNQSVLRSLTRRGNSALYVAPTNNQASDFSRKKLDNVFAYNPDLKDVFVDKTCVWNVMLKEFRVGNGISRITLRSTGGAQGADRVRGGTYNDIYVDEYQDQIEEDLPVIEECAATFDGQDGRPQAYYVYTGTPLSNQNIIQKQFNASRKYEWLIQCPHCSVASGPARNCTADLYEREVRKGGWNMPIGMQHVDPAKPFFFCQYCGRDMNLPTGTPKKFDGTEESRPWRIPPWGQWYAMNPKGKFDGYRVVRLMMPWARWRTPMNDGILDRLFMWTERRFANEVMGLSFDAGAVPITEAMIRSASKDYDLPRTWEEARQVAEAHRGYLKFAGLDWAMQAIGDDTASYTILGVFALVGSKLKLIYAHRFVGLGSNDPDAVLAHICKVMDLFEVKRLGADYGIGYKEDMRLMARYGLERVACFQYKASAAGKANSVFDRNAMKWIVPKTRTLDQLCTDIRNGAFELPRYESGKTFTDDWLNHGARGGGALFGGARARCATLRLMPRISQFLQNSTPPSAASGDLLFNRWQ